MEVMRTGFVIAGTRCGAHDARHATPSHRAASMPRMTKLLDLD
jgi:hypothetical protein